MSRFKLVENYIKSFDEKFIKKEFVDEAVKLKGLSGAGTAQLISEICRKIDARFYLEVGIYQATNLIQVAKYNPRTECIGIDNFSQEFNENLFYPGLTTEEVVHSRIKDYKLSNCHVVKDDFRNYFKVNSYYSSAAPTNIEVYFFDGPHELQDQIDGVEKALGFLAHEAFIFVDDWASENVQEASKILLERRDLRLIKVLEGKSHHRKNFNQGQVVYKFERFK